jgi:crossover junction endodeoxyribonuclease RusA
LTDAGIWTDDNYDVIKRTSFEHGGLSGSEYYRVEIDVKEVKE